jgi:hypothetical protein
VHGDEGGFASETVPKGSDTGPLVPIFTCLTGEKRDDDRFPAIDAPVRWLDTDMDTLARIIKIDAIETERWFG